MYKITLYIFPFILFNRSLYHSATLQTVSNAFSKSTNAQNNFFFLLFIISESENNVKILSGFPLTKKLLLRTPVVFHLK